MRCKHMTVVEAAAAVGAAGVSTEGADKGALTAEDEIPAVVQLHRRLAGWLCTDGKGGCVRENGVPRAAASSGLSYSPWTWYPALSPSVTFKVSVSLIQRPRTKEKSAATLASSRASACWAEKGWSSGEM
eukprot:34405-Pleurochrysis_carterae.AAC.2